MSAGGGAGAGAVVRQGHLRKLKTMKRKYFVLRAEGPGCSARLEYYESEKKFRAGATPRRAVPLPTCYNITRRLDLKQRHVIALSSKEEQFCIVADGEEDLHAWLTDLLKQHQSEDASEELLHPTQHVWQVNVQKKGLGVTKNIIGLYNLCLTDKTLTLVKIKGNNNFIGEHGIPERIEFSLRNIRRCGDSECFFYMEVGRQTATGAGELWMHTDDANIAQSMHSTIYHAMSNCGDDKEMLPYRLGSSSATEDPRSNTVPVRRQTYSDSRGRAGLMPNDVPAIRSRCDSMPSRTCPPLEPERTPARSQGQSGSEVTHDETDATADWHRTPRIPEEPDYCEMNPRDNISHSRHSSLAAEEVPGYLPMLPTLSASSGSFSGTPSTDPRFSEYQLEPATSHIIDEDERPPRAYSVGSRPAPPAPPRLRAYSVGAGGVRKVPRPPPQAAPRHNSNSAPLLPRASADDLMELDFSNNSPKTKVMMARTPPTTTYIPAKPRPKIDEYVDMSPRAGYMEMRPSDIIADAVHISRATLAKSPPAASLAPVATTPDGYVEMNYGKKTETPSLPISITARRLPTSQSLDTPAQTPDEVKTKKVIRTVTPLGSQTLFPLSLESPASDELLDEECGHPPLATLREISEEGRRSPEPAEPPHYVTLARVSSQPQPIAAKQAPEDGAELSCNPTATKTWAAPAPAPLAPDNPPRLHYAALDLERPPPRAAPPPRLYTQIDFNRSEKLNAADST